MIKRTLGPNMIKALAFAANNPGWHTFNRKHRPTVQAIMRLVRRGLVEVNEFFQFRHKRPTWTETLEIKHFLESERLRSIGF